MKKSTLRSAAAAAALATGLLGAAAGSASAAPAERTAETRISSPAQFSDSLAAAIAREAGTTDRLDDGNTVGFISAPSAPAGKTATSSTPSGVADARAC
ncbi:hypothetical protein [Streptomyces sp. NPDC090025]|uniref:hypothetical protein n=1 Tax=Streptomyces sp. NPDC090025 TaxID=3365922 RepID=UPI003836D225